jgi:hypothetical protein
MGKKKKKKRKRKENKQRNPCMLFVGKPEGKRPLGRPRHRLVNNIDMDLGEIGWSDMDSIGLAQDVVMKVRVP